MLRLFQRLILCVLFGLTAATEARQIPIEDYFKHPELRNLRMSPDGKYLAIVVPVGNSEQLVILDRETLKPTTRFIFKENQSVGHYRWVNSERIIVAPNRKLGSLDRPVATGELYAGNADGSKKLQLLDPDFNGERQAYGFRIDRVYHNESKEILISTFKMSAFPITYRMNVYSGQMTRVIKSPVRNGGVLFDNNDIARIAIGETEKGEQVIMYRNSQDEDWQTVSTSALAAGSLTPVKMAADGVHFWALSDEEASTSGLYYINGKTMQRTLLYRHPDVDIGDTISNADETQIIGVQLEPNYPLSIFFDPQNEEAKLHKQLAASFKNDSVQVLSQSRDKQWSVLYVSSDRDPGAYYLYNHGHKQIKPLLRLIPWINATQQQPMEAIEVVARDGVKMRGYLTLPEKPDKNLPLIIIPHGGPHGVRDHWGFNPEAQLFANRGYAVLQINYRGSGGYGREFMQSGFKKWGNTMQDDLTDAVKWAIKEGVADKDRVCIYGASYGGYSALMSPIREPDLYRCAVAYVGVFSLERMFTTGDISQRDEGLSFLTQVLPDSKEEQRAQSPTYNLEKLKTPIFIVHGEKDIRAHYSHFTELREALDKRQYPYEFQTKPKEAHGFYDVGNNIELYEKMLKFFDKHIGRQHKQLVDK